MAYTSMAIYTIIPRADGRSFDIQIVGDKRDCRTIFDFETEIETNWWITNDRGFDDARGEP